MPAPDPELLEMLRCPVSHLRLKSADTALVERLNQRIAAGELRNLAGQVVTEKLDGGLLREDGKVLYAVRQDIPVMLPDEAIPL